MRRQNESPATVARAAGIAALAACIASCDGGTQTAAAASAPSGSTAAATETAIAEFSKTGLGWQADLDSHRGIEAAPIMVDGTLYVTSTWSRVMAFDAVRGAKKWTYHAQVPRGIARIFCDVVNRGVVVANDRLYVGALDGRLVALNAETGAPVWTVDTVSDRAKPTGAPRIIKGKVLIGNGGPWKRRRSDDHTSALGVPWVYSPKPGFRYFYDIDVLYDYISRGLHNQPVQHAWY